MLRPALLLLLLSAVAAPAQGWLEHDTGIVLPPRRLPHPFALLAGSDGRLHLAWISGTDRRGALYAATFRAGKWTPAEQLLELRRPCQMVLFELHGKPHLLECGSGKHYFATLEKDGWKRLPYPLPRGARQPAVTRGPGQGITLVFIADVKRVSRTPRRGAITERAGKAYLLHLPAQGKPKKPVGLDLRSRPRASRPFADVDTAGQVHVVMERRSGRGARPNIGYVRARKPGSARRISRQPGTHPLLAALSEREMVAVWADRPGLVECLYDGRQWNPPTLFLRDATAACLCKAAIDRVHLTGFKGGSLLYTVRGARGWSTPLDFGLAKGPGRVVEAPDGTVHLVWEARGTFLHRSRPPAKKKSE